MFLVTEQQSELYNSRCVKGRVDVQSTRGISTRSSESVCFVLSSRLHSVLHVYWRVWYGLKRLFSTWRRSRDPDTGATWTWTWSVHAGAETRTCCWTCACSGWIRDKRDHRWGPFCFGHRSDRLQRFILSGGIWVLLQLYWGVCERALNLFVLCSCDLEVWWRFYNWIHFYSLLVFL